MEPITRKEMYLAKISGDYSGTVPEPVTRMDYYMAYSAGAYSGQLPRPIVQQEFYWAYICGATDIDLPEPVTRIDMYLGAICGGMILLPDPITREEIYLAKIAKQSEAVIKSAEGKMIVLTDSLDAPFEDFRIYGHTTQETTTGAQLFDGTFVRDTVLQTNGDLVSYSGRSTSGFVKVDANTTYEGFSKYLRVAYYDADKNCISYDDDPYTYRITPAGTEFLKFNFSNDTENGIMISKGSTALPYEPYTGGKPSPSPEYPQELVSAGDKGSIEVSVTDGADNAQTLTMLTPTGLPGIPVTSGGNYTDENGQQWICDEIDLARGKYVQRIKRVDLKTIPWSRQARINNNGWFFANVISEVDVPEETTSAQEKTMSNIAICKNPYSSIDDCIWAYRSVNSYIRLGFKNPEIDTVNKALTYLQSLNDAYCIYVLLNPIETPIPDDELAAYRALHTNYPTTTITNDEDCYMEVGYKVKPVSQYNEAKTLEWLKGE